MRLLARRPAWPVALPVALPVAAALLAGCSGEKPAASPSPSAATPSPSASLDPLTEVVRGGFASLPYPGREGYLRIEVTSTQTAAGLVVTARYERFGPCDAGDLDVACPVLWEEEHDLPGSAFRVDEALATATLADTLRDRPLSVTWRGYGETRRQDNANGNLLVEVRDATGEVSWGADRHTDPPGAQIPSQLFRRVTPRAPAQ